MTISVFQLTKRGPHAIATHARTLDEITRELPQGFYTTFSTLNAGTEVLGLHMHLQRLYVPAKELSFSPAVDEPTLRREIAELARSFLPKEARIRLILAKNDASMYIVLQQFDALPKKVYEEGVQVVTASLARMAPRVKDTGFISSSNHQRRLVGGDIFEVLLTKEGKILEGMTSNFYAVKKGTLITSQRGILLGVTRRAVLRLARGEGMSVEYRPPQVDENFNEAFLTSSSRGVVPIVSIDGKPVGQGSVGEWVKRLMKAYAEYVERKAERIDGW
ncbi:MAG TPA: aminotransferase class IV [Anaerolineales bacterium]|nr:aminotransferase class IV [Anaerolineales bacterium]HND90331.1 aminotransferase class IV [Anaerolineales bacterium]HUM26205.1 aminotransferase class IV [Anaerolineales bacterium]